MRVDKDLFKLRRKLSDYNWERYKQANAMDLRKGLLKRWLKTRRAR